MIAGAFDIGGTSIKYGVLNEQGDILFKSKTPTKAKEGGKAVVGQVIELTKSLQKDYQLDGIAISTAGQINSQEGTVIFATDSLPGYTGLNIKKEVEKVFDLPVVVDNDVNCAAIGEYWLGAAQGVDQFLCMTLGTGIGGAIVINGQVYNGEAYSAGEFGHMTLYPGGYPCLCGDEGCYEQYASSKALEQRAQHALEQSITLPELFDKARAGDKLSESIIEQWIDDVALGIKSLVHIFNPPLIVIGGGVSEQGDYLLDKLQRRVEARIMSSFQKPLTIKFAKNGNDANLQGAVRCLSLPEFCREDG
ncbi:ROK family protein [Ornithinibacillus halophilus]|uniref:ROK family protein (Putative glucokinase) n=1 Tax=Ornithinibacillus halophilus TaxID=930117 RepID=A0A1M5HLW9_9BACI|nr:ROK family protein [Ornithinibacillus halophilus]SHG16832.1 ROK family protein (putative glucokinase) [Ornithinibacillus halophilus]